MVPMHFLFDRYVYLTKQIYQRKPFDTMQSCCVMGQVALPNPIRTAQTKSITTDTYNQWKMVTGRPPRNALQLVTWSQNRGNVCIFAAFFGRICSALATTSARLFWCFSSILSFDVSASAVMTSFCVLNFHIQWTVDCAPVTLWIWWQSSYWGLVHWWKITGKWF